jgi:hypothetical protein
MAKRIARSGYNDEALTTTTKDLLTPGITSGRVFWLRGLVITETGGTTDATVIVYDQAEDEATAANQRIPKLICPKGVTTTVEFPAPGVKFITGVTATVSGGAVAAYNASAIGYEE